MSKKRCYFKCKSKGNLYNFPPITYASYKKYYEWKNILREEDKKKNDNYIIKNYKLCQNHFEKNFFTAKYRLLRHAVPTLILGITKEQEKLLCTFIENNHSIITKYDSSKEMLEEVKDKWKELAIQLNELGPKKSDDAWEEYLFEVISDLKTKEVIWRNEISGPEAAMPVVENSSDFTELELKILQLWSKEMIVQTSSDLYSIETEDNEIGMEAISEDEHSNNSGDSETSSVYETNTNNDMANEVVRFTLNVATGGHKPLLQAADLARYEAPQRQSNIKCRCFEAEDEFDAFGKDIAQQLRNMPIQSALETRRLLTSVIRGKQSKILNNSFLQ